MISRKCHHFWLFLYTIRLPFVYFSVPRPAATAGTQLKEGRGGRSQSHVTIPHGSQLEVRKCRLIRGPTAPSLAPTFSTGCATVAVIVFAAAA